MGPQWNSTPRPTHGPGVGRIFPLFPALPPAKTPPQFCPRPALVNLWWWKTGDPSREWVWLGPQTGAGQGKGTKYAPQGCAAAGPPRAKAVPPSPVTNTTSMIHYSIHPSFPFWYSSNPTHTNHPGQTSLNSFSSNYTTMFHLSQSWDWLFVQQIFNIPSGFPG